MFELISIEKFKDFYTGAPTYIDLLKLIADNGFEVRKATGNLLGGSSAVCICNQASARANLTIDLAKTVVSANKKNVPK